MRKAIYGLYQAPQAWYNELCGFLLDFGFINLRSDTFFFIFHCSNLTILLLVYVDDIILTGTSHGFINQFVTTLANRFSLKDLSALSYFLGVEAISTTEGLFLSKHKYIRDLHHKINMAGAKKVTTPLSSSESFKHNDGSHSTNPTLYRQTIGALQYLVISVTCPQHLWSGPTPLTKSSTHFPHFLQFRNVTHNYSVMVAEAMMWFWWEAIALNILFWYLNLSLSWFLLQCYTIFRERAEFGRAKTCSK